MIPKLIDENVCDLRDGEENGKSFVVRFLHSVVEEAKDDFLDLEVEQKK